MTDISQLRPSLADRYEIDREVGAGGMATVYLARDVRHDRKVALKVLNPELGAVLGVERFLAEIKVTANLQHPNLLPLFDSGQAGGLLFYVMPYVEGESLRVRLEREKQLPVDEALRIASAIAGALDYAHGHGVIHRDLKPENILLQHGQPVVADFGIALAVTKAGGSRITQTGLSLGTPQYMSPEQATGDRVVDGRTDIYSLAAMTYEMLTGDPPHTASTAQAIIAKVLTERPQSVRMSRPNVPAHVDQALGRALEKLAADRFGTSREFAEALAGRGAAPAMADAAGASGVALPVGGWRARLRDPLTLALGTLAIVGVVLGARELTRGRNDALATTSRFFLTLPGNQRVLETGGGSVGSTVAISPDGRMLAIVSITPSGSQLFIRPIDQLSATQMPGTGTARNLAFSPDGRWVAFSSGGVIKKVSVNGGPVTELGTVDRAGAVFGLSWASATRIIVGTATTLYEIPASGGAARPLTARMREYNEGGQRWPLVMPGGKSVIYMSASAAGTSTGSVIGVVSLETGKAKRLGVPAAAPLGYFDGLLVYASAEGRLMAMPYDAGRDTVAGEAFPVVEDVVTDNLGNARAALSESGTLLYLTGTSATQPVLVDWRGAAAPVLEEPRSYSNPRISRDGRQIAYTMATALGTDIWVHDRPNGTFTRLTSEGTNSRPEWSPDGKRILFWSARGGGSSEVWWVPADGSAAAELLYKPKELMNEAILSPDGEWLVYRTAPGAEHPLSIFAVRLKGDRKEIPIVTGTARYLNPRLSPDGRWLAYHSDESGSFDIYVRPFPGPGARVQVSSDGGTAPMWGPDGRTLYYLAGSGDMTQVSITTGAAFSIGARRKLFSGEYARDVTHQNYDVARDGAHLLMLRRAGDESRAVIVLNWTRELAAKRAAQAAR